MYTKWKRVTLENNKKKMKIVTESMSRYEFYENWLQEIEKFTEHYDVMRTQYKQTRILKENLPPGEIVKHMDFAENYSCKTADEIQSAYWNATQVTLHPMVIYFRDADESLAHKSYVAVSNTLSHASGTVLTIMEKLFHEVIDLPGCAEIKYVHYWTDSPTSQYRNRFIFDAINNHESKYGCPATWNYYESGHGKNACDGLGGTVKRLADQYVRSGKSVIQDADDFFNWATSSSMKEVKFFFVSKDECESTNEFMPQIQFPPIKGTLKIHSAKVNSYGQFCTRDKLCYCEICNSGLICETWRIIETEKTKKHTLPRIVEVPDDTTSADSDEPTCSAGDFVAALYESKWYIGKVVQVDDDKDVEVSFMQQRRSLFQWPAHEDIIWVSEDKVLCKIACPVPHGKYGRMYQLNEDEKIKIDHCFKAKQK